MESIGEHTAHNLTVLSMEKPKLICRACGQPIKWYQRRVWYYCPKSEQGEFEKAHDEKSVFHRICKE